MRFSKLFTAVFSIAGLATSVAFKTHDSFDKRSVTAGDGYASVKSGSTLGSPRLPSDQPEKRGIFNKPAKPAAAPARPGSSPAKPPTAPKAKTCAAAAKNPKTKGGCLCRRYKRKPRAVKLRRRGLGRRTDSDTYSDDSWISLPGEVSIGKKESVGKNERLMVDGVNGCTSVFFFGPNGRTAAHLSGSDDGSGEASEAGPAAQEAKNKGNVPMVIVDSVHTEASAAGRRIKSVILAKIPTARITWRTYALLPDGNWLSFTAEPGSTNVVKTQN